MEVALFGKEYTPDHCDYIQLLVNELVAKQASLLIYKPYFEKIAGAVNFPGQLRFFTSHTELVKQADMLFSIGGDGTLLDTIPFVRSSGIPILGINLGRLGFLSDVSKIEIRQAVASIFRKEYSIDKRTMLSLEEPKGIFGELNYGLNDLTIYRNNTTSLIVVHVYIDDRFLNSYWGDGLIVATPTGSTAYSLSVGGPILTPGSRNFVIAPIASHNLTVRPIVIQDSSKIKIRIEGREEKYLLTLDSRHSAINKDDELIVKRCDFRMNLVQMNNKDFFSTIRDKLLWGVDNRN
ncbi:MAG: NAD kinase [Bacteroidales bacterium]|nr:NAD kinase [Bacteroidales bacterium]MCF6341341.1 NAD kinase [Bacteroidales bacterium]